MHFGGFVHFGGFGLLVWIIIISSLLSIGPFLVNWRFSSSIRADLATLRQDMATLSEKLDRLNQRLDNLNE